VKFDDPEAAAFYGRLKDFSVRNRVTRVYDLEIDDTEMRMTLLGSWMLVRNRDTGAVSLFERDYANGLWNGIDHAAVFGSIRLWPVIGVQDFDSDALRMHLMRKLYRDAGADGIVRAAKRRRSDAVYRNIAAGMEYADAVDEARPLEEKAVAEITRAQTVFSRRLFGEPVVKPRRSRGGKRSGTARGYVAPAALTNGLKGIRAAFHRHFRDPELFRAILSMDYRGMTLADYVHYAGNREGVLKVCRERKNLLPLLPFVRRDQWGDDDFLSQRRWTDPSGPLSSPEFTAETQPATPSRASHWGTFEPFPDRASFQWLARSRNTVVREWVRHHKDPLAASIMAEINLPRKTPAVVAGKMVRAVAEALQLLRAFEIEPETVREGMIIAFRAYAAGWARLNEREGYRRLSSAVRSDSNASLVMDYLIHRGFAAGLPARNATWESLVRRSREWHEETTPDFQIDDGIERTWDSLVGPQVLDGCRVEPVTASTALRAEGKAMHHCVGGYAGPCAEGRYRVFHIDEPDGTRSTLGVHIAEGKAFFDQLRGPANSDPSKAARKVANRIVSMYSAALDEAAADIIRAMGEAA